MINRHHYKPKQIYNMDESGYGIGMTQSTRVLLIRDAGEKGLKATKASSGRQEWVTTIACVSAAGTHLPPLVIFKATGSVNARWLPDELQVWGWCWATSNSGWMNDTLSLDWLQRVFEPSTKFPYPSSYSSPSNQRRLLIVDGHGSHVTGRFIAFCITHGIDLLILPAHTSHKTQPFDVGIFGPLKVAMTRVADRAATYDQGRIPKDVWASLSTARATAMTEHNIRVGWRETGLYPFSPNRVLERIPPTLTTPSRPSRQPLALLPANDLQFLRACSPSSL